MADKGFELKVLIPTDDGFNISNKGIEKASYYLMYNISNRSYQLAGKIKTADLFENFEFDSKVFITEIENRNVDKIVCNTQSLFDVEIVSETDIGIVLNNLIDIVDNKKEAN